MAQRTGCALECRSAEGFAGSCLRHVDARRGIRSTGASRSLRGISSVAAADDPADPRLDDFRDLNSVDRRPDLPSGKGLVIAEGVLVVHRMLASRFHPRAMLGTDRRLGELADDLAGAAVPFYRASAEVMATAVGFHLNRGVL